VEALNMSGVNDCPCCGTAVMCANEFVPELCDECSVFTTQERRALALLVQYAAKRCGAGEDTLGAIIYTGAFRELPDGDNGVVRLARKLDAFLPVRPQPVAESDS
jgi:hypothetical protein